MSDSPATKATGNDLEEVAAQNSDGVIKGEISYLQTSRMHALESAKNPPGDEVVQKVCDLLKTEVAHQKELSRRLGTLQKDKDMIVSCLIEGKAKLAGCPQFGDALATAYYKPVKEKLVTLGSIEAVD